MLEGVKRRGKVKWFNSPKGFGFIEPDEPISGVPPARPDVFVHHSDILMSGYRELALGQRVCFETTQGENGIKAVRVYKEV